MKLNKIRQHSSLGSYILNKRLLPIRRPWGTQARIANNSYWPYRIHQLWRQNSVKISSFEI